MRTASTALLLALIACFPSSPLFGAEIPWEPNLKKAHAKAQSEGKLMLLHFVRDNCLYCDKLEEGAFKNPNIAAAVDHNFAAVKINVSDSRLNRRIAERFKIDRFPMDVIVTPDGEALAHGMSPQGAKDYIAMLHSALPAKAVQPAPTTQIAAAPKNSAPPLAVQNSFASRKDVPGQYSPGQPTCGGTNCCQASRGTTACSREGCDAS